VGLALRLDGLGFLERSFFLLWLAFSFFLFFVGDDFVGPDSSLILLLLLRLGCRASSFCRVSSLGWFRALLRHSSRSSSRSLVRRLLVVEVLVLEVDITLRSLAIFLSPPFRDLSSDCSLATFLIPPFRDLSSELSERL